MQTSVQQKHFDKIHISLEIVVGVLLKKLAWVFTPPPKKNKCCKISLISLINCNQIKNYIKASLIQQKVTQTYNFKKMSHLEVMQKNPNPLDANEQHPRIANRASFACRR